MITISISRLPSDASESGAANESILQPPRKRPALHLDIDCQEEGECTADKVMEKKLLNLVKDSPNILQMKLLSTTDIKFCTCHKSFTIAKIERLDYQSSVLRPSSPHACTAGGEGRSTLDCLNIWR